MCEKEEKKKSEKEKNRAILTFNLYEEYQIRIEEPLEFNNSYFKDVYSKASNAVADIIEQSSDKNGDLYPFIKEKQDSNNIVAFVGNRGTGKTSAMVSFAKYLLGLKEGDNSIDTFEKERLSKKKYISLPTIDPSLFENHENIIEVVLAQMFSEFECMLKKETENIEMNDRRIILEHFEKVYERLQTIKKGSSNYDGEAIETLSKLGDSTRLREEFKKLVEQYIKIKTANKENFLIIPIDDFDLNVKAAAEMSEQIRKYFMIPNVIILMSVNMDQLKDAKELSIRKDYNGMVRYMEEDPSVLAVQYLLKLIPDNRRFHMPEIKIHIKDTNIKIIRKKEKNGNDSETKPIEAYIFNTIFKKTGLIYIPKQNKTHILTQSNLRRLTELVYFIEKKLTDVEIIKEENLIKKEKGKNLQIFEDYLVDIYIPSILSKIYLQNYNRIIESEVQRVNHTTLHTLYDIVKGITLKFRPDLFTFKYSENLFPNTHKEDPAYSKVLNYGNELAELLNISNNPYNISLGDVLFMINESEKIINDSNFTIFCDSIRLYYSLIILKAKNEKRFNDVKAICGDSLLPNESLFRVVPLKEYYGNKEKTQKGYFSRTSYSIDIDKDEEFEKIKNDPEFKLFTIYSGINYPFRRRSIKGFEEKYKINENKNFTLDIFAAILNMYNYKNGDEDKDNKCELIPLHSIDMIEAVLYRHFSIEEEKLYDEKKEIKLHHEIEQIYTQIISRKNKIMIQIEGSNKETPHETDENYISNILTNNEYFKTTTKRLCVFIRKLESMTQNKYNKVLKEKNDNDKLNTKIS